MASAIIQPKRARLPPDSSVKLSWTQLLLAFVIPITALVKWNAGGTLFGQDLVGLILLPLLLSRPGSLLQLGQIRSVFIVLGIWLAGQVLTDVIRGSAPDDYIRGWSKIVFFGIQLAALWLLFARSWSLFVSYMLGAGVYAMLSVRQLEAPYSDYPWKFGLGIGLLLIVAAACSVIPGRKRGATAMVAPTLIGATALFVLLKGGRSLFGSAFMAVLYLIVSGLVSSRPKLARAITPRTFLIFIAGGLLAAQGLVGAYGWLATSGALGGEAQSKYEAQRGSGSLLESGRVETLVSLQAVEDSPIIGHGSWAHDVSYVRLLYRRAIEYGVNAAGLGGSEGHSDLIPSHSHLLGAWVEAGIAGAAFWLWILGLCGIALYRLLRDHRSPSPILVVAIFTMAWDVLFSPFGADVRFLRAAEIVIMLYLLETTRPSRFPARLAGFTDTRSAARRARYVAASVRKDSGPLKVPGSIPATTGTACVEAGWRAARRAPDPVGLTRDTPRPLS